MAAYVCPRGILIGQLIALVTLGSVDGAKIFGDYIIKAKPLDKYNGTPFMGHFEPQWDASPVCCGKGSWPVS